MIGMDLIPRWLHREYDMPDDEMHIPPTVRHEPEFTAQDEDTMIMQQVAVKVAQARRERERDQVALAEMAMEKQSLLQKIEFQNKEIADITLELAQERNNSAAKDSLLDDYRMVMEYMKKAFDMLGTKAPAKKPRNGNGSKSKPTGNPAEPVPPK